LQFGGVVVLGKIVTDGDLPVPAYLAIRFAAAALFFAVLRHGSAATATLLFFTFVCSGSAESIR
jgi:hypothetical protein